MLFVHQLLPEDALLVVQIEEHGQILCQLVVLLSFDDALDFTLFGNFLADLVNCLKLSLLGVRDERLLLLAIDLSLKMLLLPHLFAQKGLMVLVELAGLPQRHLEAAGLSLFRVIGIGRRSRLKHLLLDALTCLVRWSEVRGVELGFSLVRQDLLV